ncbi:MAG: aromatic ring-hydroxylating dioxygenase subunit alpha [Alphaproteobacteria bacterium]|nr:aromatic ring-hydroxylating dioxygenase subunit alpha [Alphaproteobacteria bacterium]
MVPTTPEALGEVMQPVAGARGLPNNFYIDAATYETEKQRVFFANWSAIGFAKDVPEIGDARPVDFVGMPLVALRDGDGEVRVFQNTCRHRGMILIDQPTNVRGAIRCPYHSWCYGLDGALKSTPLVGGPGRNDHPDIDPSRLGLFEIRSRVWRDVIFVNVSGTAADFETYAADLIERWRDFDKPLYHGGAESSFALEVQANWKLAVENYCESYHLPWIHPGLNKYSRIQDHYHIEVPGHYSGQGTTVYNPGLDVAGRRFADFEGTLERWSQAAEYVAFYPNVLFGAHRDHAYAILLEPHGPERTIERVSIYYASDEMLDDGWATMRATNARQWEGIFIEDVFVVEGMQRGRHGVKFDGGKFSPVMDGPTHCFHHWVASQFAGESTAPFARAAREA